MIRIESYCAASKQAGGREPPAIGAATVVGYAETLDGLPGPSALPTPESVGVACRSSARKGDMRTLEVASPRCGR